MPKPEAPDSGTRLRRIVESAQQSRYYRNRPALGPGCHTNVPIEAFRGNPEEFRNPRARRMAVAFPNPWPSIERLALVADGYRTTRNIRAFADHDMDGVMRYRPNVLAAPVEVLKRWAVQPHGLAGMLTAVIALTGPLDGALWPSHRELFWRSFSVPLFERFRGLGGEILAAECDAHSGLHIRSEDVIFECGPELIMTSLMNLEFPVVRLATGLRASISDTVCGCGETSPRLIYMEPLHGNERLVPAKPVRSARRVGVWAVSNQQLLTG